jgi:hypothetical protein
VIDGVAQDGGYIMDASALIMNDAQIENVRAMIEFTRDYGVYSQAGSTNKSMEEIKKVPRQISTTGIRFRDQKRRPGVCIPWEEKRNELPVIMEREELTKKTWEDVDSLGYGFCWVNLTW